MVNQVLQKEEIRMIQRKSDLERKKWISERTRDEMKKLNHRSENENDLRSIEFKSIEQQLSDTASQMVKIDEDISEIDDNGGI